MTAETTPAMTTAQIIAGGWGREPKPGDTCGCGRPAVVVYHSGSDDIPDCGHRDGGANPTGD